MADLVITRTIKLAGVLTDADSAPVLRDPTDAFGLKQDGGATLVAAGTALVKQSTGVYALTVSDLEAGESYTYWIETTVGGQTTRQEKHYSVPAADADPEADPDAPTTVADAITAAAIDGIQTTVSDGQSVTRMSVKDQIAAAEFTAANSAAQRGGLGIRRIKMVPPGNDC